jgi:hypothetical protein
LKPDFSEFSYGFALTSDLMDRYGLRQLGAPLFPSLIEEGKEGGGFDVKMPGLPVFFQFKTSEQMTRSTAREASLLGLPYYRMRLRPLQHSQQHNLLLDLEQRGNDVFYAAHQFHLPDELNEAYLAGTVEPQTWLFAPSDIGPLPDSGEHCVVFARNKTAAYFCSDPRELRRIDHEALFRRHLPERLRGPRRHPTLLSLVDELLSVYEGRRGPLEHDPAQIRLLRDRRRPPELVTYLSQTLFDSHLLFLPEAGAP